jgi:hypothetical protein
VVAEVVKIAQGSSLTRPSAAIAFAYALKNRLICA